MYAYLNEVMLTVYDDGDCGNLNDIMYPEMICAGDKSGGKDVCLGDGGGPLVATDPGRNNSMSLVGVSCAYGCNNPQHSGVREVFILFSSVQNG